MTAPTWSSSTGQQPVTWSLSRRRARWTRDFMPGHGDVELVGGLLVGLALQVHPGQRVARLRRQPVEQRLQTAGSSRVASLGRSVDVRLRPQVQVGQVLVWPTGPVVVDHGVAGRAVEPCGDVIDPIQRSGRDAADDDVLGDVSGELGVASPTGHECPDPAQRLGPLDVHVRGGVDGGFRLVDGDRSGLGHLILLLLSHHRDEANASGTHHRGVGGDLRPWAGLFVLLPATRRPAGPVKEPPR